MELQDTLIVPVVIGLVEIAKRQGLSSRWAPFLSLALGVAGALLLIGLTPEAGLQGILFGLSAAGLYSGGKAIAK